MPPPPPAEEPLRTRRRGGFGSGGMAELPWLRKQTKEAAAANLNQRTARGRPPSSATSQRPLSSSPSLLSLDNNQPSSPTTTAGPSYPSSGSLPHFRHSAAPTASQGHHSHLPQHPPRSHASLPVIPSSSSASHSSYPQQPGRHTNQQERIYSEARYDAEFDRGNASSSRAGPSGTQPGGSSGARGLFNPDSAHALAADARRREDGSSRRPRSKREPVVADDLGWAKRGKDSKDSLESEDSGRPGSRSSKEGRHRRRREGESGRRREEGEAAGGSNPQLVGGSGAAAASSRQLFDPRRDDPVKFSQGGGPLRKPTASDARSFAGSVLSLASSVTTVSDASGGQAESTQGPGSGRREGESNSFMMQLKRAYKDITDLETKLQDEHRAALAAAAREEEAGSGVRIQGGGKKYDDEYWVKLATGHKQLADAHYSFLQMALDPRQPASLHSLPQKYNIPNRLWQTGFHQLLERMRHAVSTSPPPPSTNSTDSSSTNVLEHLIEFIQYAYGHYSQLFEDPSIAVFRSSWIESLGDLARYRMAVAGLASRVSAAQAPLNGRQANRRDSFVEEPVQREQRPIDAASIGDAALGDWEVEEQESWRVMARDWYGQGVAETPGTGRLQHHLALLSKGDELRGLYHYSKSLCAAHPYVSARESILPLFEDELQARRTQPDVTKAELFVHLHGMLFTKISLDDFEECLERFLERLTEEACLIGRAGDWASLGSGSAAPFGDAEWFMIGVINIAALLQYGAEDGILKKNTTKEAAAPPSKPASSTAAAKPRTPQAIMLNPSSLKRSESVNDEDDAGSATGDQPASPRLGANKDVVKQLQQSTEEDPLVFRLAQRLTFSILDIMLQHPYRIVGDSKVVNPYIVMILTFVSHLSQHAPALRHLERAIPWARLTAFFNTIPSSIEVRMDVPTKLSGGPLPEDWCIRGMDWTGRHLFGRGYWRSKMSSSSTSRRDEMPPIGPPTAGSSFESEMDALRFDLAALDEFDEGEGDAQASAQLATGRWRRVAMTAAWLARNVAGLDLDVSAKETASKFVILGSLDTKLRRWRKEEEEAVEAERTSRLSAWSGAEEEVEIEGEDESEEEDDEDPSDSFEVRELKARRRQLKAVIKQARQATRGPIESARNGSAPKRKVKLSRTTIKFFAGFTVLVFDTNVLLASMKLFRALLESETWTIVVPLAVITELDGLKKNAASLGTSASEAIAYLEAAVRTYPRHLKIQTSRGNYLKDLAIRSENIDFAGNGGDFDAVVGFSHDFARSMDDVILRAVAWQKDHFTSRLAIVNPHADRRLVPVDAAHVVLVTGDRNLRLKARARGLDAATSFNLEAKENG